MWKILNIEVRKLKSSGMFWVVFGIPFFLTVQNLMLSRQFFGAEGPNWPGVHTGQLGLYATFLLPGIIAVVMAAMMRVEHKGNGWKYLFSLPLNKSHVYTVKFCLGAGLIFLNLLMTCIGNVLVGIILGVPEPIPSQLFLWNPSLAFVLAIPLMALQFLLGLVFTQPLVPIGIGVGLGMPAILMANSAKYWKFYPWTYPVITFFGEMFQGPSDQKVLMLTVSFILFALLFVGGLIYFKRRDIIG